MSSPSHGNVLETALETKILSPPAQRALAEAAERRAVAEAEAAKLATEINGPKGSEPTRFGDWERKGITYDF